MSSDMHDEKMPAVFLSHGAPTLADDEIWTKELASWSAKLPVPRSILVVSAHWEAAPLTVAATTPVPLFYDFSGFPRHYYNVRYEAPGAPGLAESVTKLLSGPGASVHRDPGRGLDHGAYVPLMEMYPNADIPVLQISMPTLDPAALFEVGRKLAPLRDEGVLILGSGFSTHNLQQVMSHMGGSPSDTPPTWSSEFDDWLQRALSDGDIDALIDFHARAPAAAIAHPRTEHFAPLFVTLGAVANDTIAPETAIDGFWYGLSKRSVQFA